MFAINLTDAINRALLAGFSSDTVKVFLSDFLLQKSLNFPDAGTARSQLHRPLQSQPTRPNEPIYESMIAQFPELRDSILTAAENWTASEIITAITSSQLPDPLA